MEPTTIWHFTCSHTLIQIHKHPNHGLAPMENVSGLCPSCSIQSLKIAAMKKKDENDLQNLKEEYTDLAAQITQARAKGDLKSRNNLIELEGTLEDLLENYKLKLLATSDAKKDLLATHLRTELLKRYDEVNSNICMLLDLETLNLRRMKRNAEYEECEHNKIDAGKWHFCDSTERVMIPEDQLLMYQRTVLKEALKEARDGLKLWRKAWEAKVEGSEGFESAIEQWWGWVLKNMRDKV